MPRSAASLRRASAGSAPGDSTNTSGLPGLLSARAPARPSGSGSTKRRPRELATNAAAAGNTRSGRRQRTSSRRCSSPQRDSHSPGSSAPSGSAARNQASHAEGEESKAAARPLKAGRAASREATRSQASSLIQLGAGLGGC
jgi:hypothetical protein